MPDPASPATAKAKPPGRRRPGPNASKSANRAKNYASENDAAGVDPNFRPDFVRNGQKAASGAAGGATNGGPSTPRKKAQKNNAAAQAKSPPATNQQPASGKPNRRNKNGPKNGATPNAVNKQQDGQRTPPAKGTAPISLSSGVDGGQDSLMSSSAPSAAPATQVFAGNSFHASPAPSALPRPSFMQKSSAAAFASPESPRARPTSGLSLAQQPSPPASDSELPSSTATTGGHSLGRNPLFQHGADAPQNASPLDVLFRADRAEKAQQNRRASAANIYNGGLSQPFASPRVDAVPETASSYTFPRDVSQQQHQLPVRRPAPNLRSSSSGISAAELDGTPGQPIGPAFSTPFQERMRAVKPADIRGSPSGPAGGPIGGFNGFRNAGPGQQTMPSTGAPGNYMLTPPLTTQSPGGPTMNAGSDLEASLKRMLFNSSSASPSSAPPTMSSPSRHQPVPEFAGHPPAAPFPGAYRRGDEMFAHHGSPSHMAHGPPPPQGRPFGPVDPRFQGAPSPYNGIPYNGMPYNGMPCSGAPNGGDPNRNKAAMENSIRQILRLGSNNN